MAIQNLAKVSTLSLSDLIAVFSNSLGSDAAATLQTLVTFLQGQLTANGSTITQYFAPNATGWAVTVTPPVAGENVYLLITPTAGFATGGIAPPPQTSCVDGQTFTVSCTQAVTTLTVVTNGATAVNGAPTALTANGFFRLRYDGPSKSWYRNG